MDRYDKAGKQEADMRDWTRRLTATLHFPHPRVTASPLSLEERALARVSKDGPRGSDGSRRRTGQRKRAAGRAPPHHEGSELQHREASRSRPAWKGVVEGRDIVLAEYELARRG